MALSVKWLKAGWPTWGIALRFHWARHLFAKRERCHRRAMRAKAAFAESAEAHERQRRIRDGMRREN